MNRSTAAAKRFQAWVFQYLGPPSWLFVGKVAPLPSRGRHAPAVQKRPKGGGGSGREGLPETHLHYLKADVDPGNRRSWTSRNATARLPLGFTSHDPKTSSSSPAPDGRNVDYTGLQFNDVRLLSSAPLPPKAWSVRGQDPNMDRPPLHVVGNALRQLDAIYGARHVSPQRPAAPIETPRSTLNRLCGSGIQSVIHRRPRCSSSATGPSRLAGGMENMTQAPHRDPRRPKGLSAWARCARGFADGGPQGPAATCSWPRRPKIAYERGLPRPGPGRVCCCAATRLGAAAVKSGVFKDEIVPVMVKVKGKMVGRGGRPHPPGDDDGGALGPPGLVREGTGR